jgi:hypothetical protein
MQPVHLTDRNKIAGFIPLPSGAQEMSEITVLTDLSFHAAEPRAVPCHAQYGARVVRCAAHQSSVRVDPTNHSNVLVVANL